MDRAGLRDYARKLSRIEPHDVSNDELDMFLDEGYDRVVMHTTWPWMTQVRSQQIPIEETTEIYDLGDPVYKITSVMHDNPDYELQFVTKDVIDRQHHMSDAAEGDPTMYYWNGSEIYIHPSPSSGIGNIIVHYVGLMDFGPADTDEPPFHSTFHRILVDWMLHRLWEMEEDFEKSQEYRMRFEEGITRMTAWYNTLVETTPSIYGESVFTAHASNMPFLTDPQPI